MAVNNQEGNKSPVFVLRQCNAFISFLFLKTLSDIAMIPNTHETDHYETSLNLLVAND
jgi:hypothetical protein